MSRAGNGSTLRDEDLAAERIRGGLRQELPGGCRVLIADGRECRPEIITTGSGLNAGGGHLHLGTLILGCLLLIEVRISSGHFSLEPVHRGLGRVGTLRTVELIDVISQQVWIGQQRVVRSVILSSCCDHRMGALEFLLQLLQVLKSGSGLLRLVQQGIFHYAGVAVQQGRGLGTEVLQDLKTFAADVLQVLVAALDARRCARRHRLRVGRWGIGLRLWVRRGQRSRN